MQIKEVGTRTDSWRRTACKDIESFNIKNGAETENKFSTQLVLKSTIFYDSEPVLSTSHSYKNIMQCLIFGRRRRWRHGSAECSVVARGGCCLGLQCDKVNRTYGEDQTRCWRCVSDSLLAYRLRIPPAKNRPLHYTSGWLCLQWSWVKFLTNTTEVSETV
jgi:hypothetical protein